MLLNKILQLISCANKFSLLSLSEEPELIKPKSTRTEPERLKEVSVVSITKLFEPSNDAVIG